nr:MAG TPA: hypothetical protein [Caudoviricetes sp.]
MVYIFDTMYVKIYIFLNNGYQRGLYLVPFRTVIH